MATAMACNDPEGFRVVSDRRPFDLTLCFEEGVLLSSLLAVLLVASVLSSLSLCLLESRKRATRSNVVLGLKLTCLLIGVAASALNVFLIHGNAAVPQWHILEPIALASAGFLTYYHHTRRRMSSAILLLFWPLYSGAIAIWLRSILAEHPNGGQFRTLLILKGVVTLAGVASFFFECIGPEIGLPKDEKSIHESPLLTANIFNRWFFGWLTPLLAKGSSTYITEEDLPSLVPSDESEVLGRRLEGYLAKNFGVWRSLSLAYGGPYLTALFLKVAQDVLAFSQPQFLRLLLAYISRYQHARFSGDGRPEVFEGFSIVAIMFAASVIQTILLNQYFQRTFETGMRVRAGLVTAIFGKALILSNDEKTRTTGDITNLMSVDAIRMQDLCTYCLIAISGPLQITLAFISLYNLLGWACFVGVGVMILSMPLTTAIARALKRMQEQQMKNRDERTRLMTELLSNIKSIKLHAWELPFVRRIMTVRNDKELNMLRKIGLLNSCSMTLWSGIPLLVAFSSFATAAVTSSRPLTADVIFPCISLFMLLQFPLAMLSQVLSNIIEAMVSVKRLQDFFRASELQPDAREVVFKPNLEIGDEVLSIEDGEFCWDSTDVVPTLENINFVARKGQLTAVMGRVGAGKTSLLSAIIGDMSKSEGKVRVFGSVAYAPQNPWIMSASVRDNILFNHVYDEDFYAKVIEACALGPDLLLLPEGDQTEVGEKGITVRLSDEHTSPNTPIALRRTTRSNKFGSSTLCTLALTSFSWTTFSLLSIRTSLVMFLTTLLDHVACFPRKRAFSSPTRSHFVSQFEQLVFIRRGIIAECGSYQTLMKLDGDLSKLVRGHGTSTSGSSTPYVASGSGSATPSEETVAVNESASEKAGAIAEKLTAKFQKAVLAPPKSVRASNSAGLSQEHREKGRVKAKVYSQYIEAASRTGFAVYIIFSVLQQLAGLLGNLTLRAWGEHNSETGDNSGMFKYLMIYGAFSLGGTLVGGAARVVMWVLCSLRSSQKLHESMLSSLMAAPLSFFELTPTGRTLNLFSRDLYVVDQLLTRYIENVVRTSLVCLSILVVIGVSFPPFLVSVIPLTWFYMRVMSYYLATSRELKRLDAVSKSPIFAFFSESLTGVSTIRSFNQQTVFIKANQRHIDRNQICYLPSISVNRWLSIRLEIVGAVIILLVASLAMIALVTTGVDAGLVGLVLSYAMNATSSLNWVVLKRVSLEISPKEKLGICGRTGAGKSSLLLALFRIIEPVEGSVVIDGIDISNIGLHDLRSAISIVPQSPDLFEGSLRLNIDPVEEHDDAEIWMALEQAHLKEYVESLPQGLDAPVREGGQSLSAGQRQLLCFARALLRKSKILVLDEATSAVDLDTDKAIQEIIQGPAFADVTIITIAHRLNTIIGGSKILVMNAGTVAEFDSPQALLANKESLFHALAAEAGLV
ncbi:hypothetical protein MKEN_01442500 [Mycena kentingensis (nom. inval.)]|nr:hypothetical protein MKEN_01442500 [Mycena kentingensis (nom. inval.)]